MLRLLGDGREIFIFIFISFPWSMGEREGGGVFF